MKSTILGGLLCWLALVAHGQALPSRPQYAIYEASVYSTLGDTLGTAAFYLVKGQRVEVSEASGRWATITRGKKTYYVQSIYLATQPGSLKLPAPAAKRVVLPVVENKLLFEGVVKTDTALSKAAAYQLAREWFVNSFVSGKAVLQLEDQLEGKLLGNGRSEFHYLRSPDALMTVGQIFKYQFTVKIEVREGRFRYQFYNFLVDDDPVYYQGRVILTRHFSFDEFYRNYQQGSSISFTGAKVADSYAAKQRAAKDYEAIFTLLQQDMQRVAASLSKALNSKRPATDW